SLIDGCTITDNTATSGGGIVAGGRVTIQNTTIAGNRAVAGYGGGVAIEGVDAVTFVNDTISGNASDTSGGGGIGVYSGSGGAVVTVENCTITNNSAGGTTASTGTGGGIYFIYSNPALRIISSIVAGNTNAAAPDIASP